MSAYFRALSVGVERSPSRINVPPRSDCDVKVNLHILTITLFAPFVIASFPVNYIVLDPNHFCVFKCGTTMYMCAMHNMLLHIYLNHGQSLTYYLLSDYQLLAGSRWGT